MSIDVTSLISHCWHPLHATGQSDAVYFTDAELTRYFAEHLKRLAQRFGVFVVRDTQSITLVQSTAVYNTPPRHISTLFVSLNNSPLIASSTKELELQNPNFQTTQGTPKRWYQDKVGANRIGFQPVPDAGSDSDQPEVILHQYPCNLDVGHTDVDIEAPNFVGDYLETQILGECYSKESDQAMPEVAKSCRELAGLYESVIENYWGMAQ
jgi:hypothetical protein